MEETFTYDGMNRLTGVTLKRPSGQDLVCAVTYDALGRMTSRQAVTAENQAITYTGFDKVGKVKQGNDSLCYTYGYDRQRILMEEHVGGLTRTKRYVGNCEFVTESDGTTTAEYCLTYLTGPTGVYAVVVTEGGHDKTHYVLKDNLGSWTTITDAKGTVEQRLSFDPWGNLRNPNTWSGSFTDIPMFDRGFTGHEHLYDFGLINMNGRMYDPVMSSFLSVDHGHTALEPRDLGLRQLDTSDPIITWMEENSLHGSGNGVKGESSDSKEQGEGEKYIFGYSDPNAVKVKGPGACLFASLGMICKRLNQWNLDPVFWKEQEALYFAEKEQHGYDSNNIEDFVQWVGENNNIGFSFEIIGIMNIPDANKEKSQVIIVIELSSEKQIAQNEGNKGHVAVLNSFTISSVNGYTSLKMTFGDPSPQRFLYNYNTTSPYILPEGINSWIFYKFNINNYMKP